MLIIRTRNPVTVFEFGNKNAKTRALSQFCPTIPRERACSRSARSSCLSLVASEHKRKKEFVYRQAAKLLLYVAVGGGENASELFVHPSPYLKKLLGHLRGRNRLQKIS